jgi:hypothetical protein
MTEGYHCFINIIIPEENETVAQPCR